MAKKKVIRVFAALMALIMTLSVVIIVDNSDTALAAVSQSQIDKLKKQQKEIEKKKQEMLSQINSMEFEQSTTLAKKEVLDSQIQLTQEDIANITEQIDTYTQLIDVKKAEVIQAQQNEDAQWATYKIRMRSMEENGTISYISVIFQSTSFSELLANMDIVGEIMDSDERLYEQLKASKLATQDAQASLEAAKADQEVEKANLEVKNAELGTQLAAADALLDKIEDDIAAAKDLYQKELEAGKQIQSDINTKMEELKKQTQQVVGTGTFLWPTPSCKIVTSRFGQRYHPIYHEYRNHTGVDIGAKYGASVVASDDGVVIISTYSSSYGNYIVISHGNGIATLYAHLSSKLVKVNDKVTKGNTIGKVGSTGASTGPHLHFEVSIGGVKKNPLTYFSGYTISE